MIKAYKPNRPVRIGTKIVMTDAEGFLPGENKKAEEKPASKAKKGK